MRIGESMKWACRAVATGFVWGAVAAVLILAPEARRLLVDYAIWAYSG